MLAKPYRLRAKQDFRRVYQRGKSRAYPYFVIYTRVNRLDNHRVGFSVSKKIGKAVVRNRVKRRFRQAARELAPLFRPGWDYIFVVRQGAKDISYAKLKSALEKALRQDEKA